MALSCLWGCRPGAGAAEPPLVPLSKPLRLCNEPLVEECRSVPAVESWLRSPNLHIVQATVPSGGNQGAYVLTLKEDSNPLKPIYFRAKWRSARAPSFFNEPRRELVAYGTQQLFLHPDEYVVPPTSGYCFPLSEYQAIVDPAAKATWPGVPCVHGYLTFWLGDPRNVASAAGAFDDDAEPILDSPHLYSRERFFEDGLYAGKLARLNTLAVLVRHGDAHEGQFLVAEDPFRVYSVDHTVSLTSIRNPLRVFEEDWSSWRVPAIPAALARNLQTLDESHVRRLAVIESYQRVEDRLVPHAILRTSDLLRGSEEMHRKRPERVFDPDQKTESGVHFAGETLRVGASAAERDVIWSKIRDLQQMLEDGTLPTFTGTPESIDDGARQPSSKVSLSPDCSTPNRRKETRGPPSESSKPYDRRGWNTAR